LHCCIATIGANSIAKSEQIGETLVLNPGALYRANPHTIAVVELPEVSATIVAV
jgi:Icc-related predicted phosphoesterase